MAHLSGGEVSLSTSVSSGVTVEDYRGGFFTAVNGVAGGYDLAARIPGDASGRVYVSSRVDNVIGSFLVRDDKKIVDTTRAQVDAVYPATDVRGLAFAPGGGTLYLTNRAPAALVALDMTLEDGLPRQESLWAVEVCADPAKVRLGPGPAGELLAYVVCFAASQIYVIDTSMAKVVDQIATGSGPYDLVLDPNSKRAFVTNFLERTVGVIDLDPTRATYHRMIARIGLAENLVKE
jgi:YVTN family beta-propeller protein